MMPFKRFGLQDHRLVVDPGEFTVETQGEDAFHEKKMICRDMGQRFCPGVCSQVTHITSSSSSNRHRHDLSVLA